MSNPARTDAVSPHELARKRGLFTGEIPIAAFPRLSPLVLAGSTVVLQLSFARDEDGRTRVRGHAAFAPTLQCQRCLEPIERAVDVTIDLCVVRSDEQAAAVAEALEAFVLIEDAITIVDLVEDDLLLALPSQVCEAYETCPNRPELSYPVEPASDTNEPDPERPNPFGVLAGLKNQRN
jgi:DUF177 domain-containing protein